jgi:hypothetical protein
LGSRRVWINPEIKGDILRFADPSTSFDVPSGRDLARGDWENAECSSFTAQASPLLHAEMIAFGAD